VLALAPQLAQVQELVPQRAQELVPVLAQVQPPKWQEQVQSLHRRRRR
jgi:hypothetical protein